MHNDYCFYILLHTRRNTWMYFCRTKILFVKTVTVNGAFEINNRIHKPGLMCLVPVGNINWVFPILHILLYTFYIWCLFFRKSIYL